jgi:hypothetical protein
MGESRHTTAAAAAAGAAAAAETGGVRGNLGELRARATEGKLAWGTSIGRTSDLLVLPLRQVRASDALLSEIVTCSRYDAAGFWLTAIGRRAYRLAMCHAGRQAGDVSVLGWLAGWLSMCFAWRCLCLAGLGMQAGRQAGDVSCL